MIECRRVVNDNDIKSAYELRMRVFVDEQRVPPEMELDEYDKEAIHVIACEGEKVVGTGRLVIEDNKGRIGRVAVDREHRGKGIGNMVMTKLEEEARKLKLTELYLHAQTHALDFYRKLGYIPRGEVFDEAGIEHQEMYKQI